MRVPTLQSSAGQAAHALGDVLRERAPGLFETLQTWPWLATLRTLRLRFREDRLGLTAGSLTFTTLISLVPLVTVMLAVFSAFPMFARFEDSLQKYFLQTLVPVSISQMVLTAVTQFAAKAKGVGSVGIVALLFTALTMMLTIDRTLNSIWRVRKPRPIAQRVLVYWAAVTLGPLVLGVSLTLSSYALSASQGIVGVMPGGVSLLLDSFEFVLLAAGLAGLFHYVPNTHVRWRHALAGGISSAIGFELAKWMLGWYLAKVSTYSMVYGAFATLPILLVWIYLAWVIVLLGAVIAAYAPSLQSRVTRWPDGPGSRLQLAIAVLRELADAQRKGTRGCSASGLAAALRTDPLQTEPIVDALLAFDWIGRLAEPGDPRLVLLCDPASTPAAPLLAQLLLEPAPIVSGLWQRAGFDSLTVQELIAE
jgi:membrane protein